MQLRIVVKKGQRYIQKLQNSSQGMIWEVVSVAPDMAQIQHACLVRVSDRFDFKTLSCSMLDGKHDFSLTSQ